MAEANLQADFLAKTIMVGEAGVDKTAILYRLYQGNFSPEYICTIGVEVKVKIVEIDGRRGKVQIWDTAGQERFRAVTRAFYKGACGIIVCYAINNRESFEKIEYWMEELKKHASSHICVVLVGTKSDLLNERVVSIDEGRKLAESYGIKFFETNAKENLNINEMFQAFTRDVKELLIGKEGDTPLYLRRNNQQNQINCFKCS